MLVTFMTLTEIHELVVTGILEISNTYFKHYFRINSIAANKRRTRTNEVNFFDNWLNYESKLSCNQLYAP